MAAGARPEFSELPVQEGAPPGSSWGVFGEADELGTLNFIGPEQVRSAGELIRTGRVFALNWDVALPAPPFFMRQAPNHTIFEKFDGVVLDDWLDSFYLQSSTQWDGLRHFSDADYGWYNGATRSEVGTPSAGRLGIEHWARRGIAAVVADNPALEAAHRVTGSDLSLHRALLARLGMPLGELWVLGPLAADCAAACVYECFLTSSPLNVGGGAGSPANALAIK